MHLPADAALAQLSLDHLQHVVAIDSQSDELSPTIPTTPGQVRLADAVAEFHAALGATVERDDAANVIAVYPPRGRGVDKAPVALLVHLDTARGTQAVPSLHVLPAWDGRRIPFPRNPTICVDAPTYPAMAAFLGHDLVHGPGDFPFGLDDKLGLAHCMTVARVLAESPEIDRPPLLFVGRPDEEVGRHEAVLGLADLFARRGVRWAFTVDGILPYEINLENFNAAMASVTFPAGPPRPLAGAPFIAQIGGVNTHGATAAAEGHRGAPRLAAEWLAALDPQDAVIVDFASDALRDCDARVRLRVAPGAEPRVRAALAAVMDPHLRRGASWSLAPADPADLPAEGAAAEAMLRFVHRFLSSRPGFVLTAEDSAGHEGYTQPMRARPQDGALRLDVRIRDFDPAALERRIDHLRAEAGDLPVAVVHQYINMGPRLAAHPGLAEAAERAAHAVGVAARRLPIRGGTGVDPFLDRDIPVANLGTGYFAPESEKELTSLQLMAGHARWLLALVADLAAHGPPAHGPGTPAA